jgi:recombination endonuclease VII
MLNLSGTGNVSALPVPDLDTTMEQLLLAFDTVPEYGKPIPTYGKYCTHCHVFKTVDQFYKDWRMRNGLESWCRACMTEAGKARARRISAQPKTPPEYKKCRTCKQRLPASSFTQQASQMHGLSSYCRACHADKRLNYIKWTKYRIRHEDYERMLEEQQGLCGICQQPFKGKPHIDHNHASGAVRGLLCTRCNLSLGFFENGNFVELARAYLGRFSRA